MNVRLNGMVIPNDHQWLYDWFEIEAFSPAVVRKAVEDAPEGEELVFEINSGGGDVFAGFEIYSILRAAKCGTVAMVQSLAASAASTVMIGCRRVLLSPVAQVMIHLPQTSTEGGRREHETSLRMLDSVTQSILNGYQLRCGAKASRERLEELMGAETWLPAQDAVELGLADAVVADGAEVDMGVLPLSVVNAAGTGIRLAANAARSDPAALMAQYERMVSAGIRPAAEGHPVKRAAPPAARDDWRDKARLDIERNRFL